jgi:adenylate cyclase
MQETDKTTIIKSNTDIHKQITESFAHIELFFKGSDHRFGRNDLPLSIGRDNDVCTLVTDNSTASRRHCTLEIKDGQFGISDHSTNGTYIKIGRAETVLIKNSFYPLISQGNISFGEPIDLESKEVLFFRVISRPQTSE